LPWLALALGCTGDQAPVRPPGGVAWGATVAQVRAALAPRCSTLRERTIDPPFLTGVRVQVQLDCTGLAFFGAARRAEFIVGDDSLEQVWVLVEATERDRIVAALAAAHGTPTHAGAEFTAFADDGVAWREAPAEVLFHSPRQAAEWRALFEADVRRRRAADRR
jgi:hypothetical protein